MVNQIELHPFYQQAEALKVMALYGVVPQAWGPLAEAQKHIFEQKTLVKIAASHEKTVAQVVLRWHYQRGVPTIPQNHLPRENGRKSRYFWFFSVRKRDERHCRAGPWPQ